MLFRPTTSALEQEFDDSEMTSVHRVVQWRYLQQITRGILLVHDRRFLLNELSDAFEIAQIAGREDVVYGA